MARIGFKTKWASLTPGTTVTAELEGVRYEPETKFGPRLRFSWLVGGELVTHQVSPSPGTYQGKPSWVRSILNILAEKELGTDLWFDPETLEWGYVKDGPAYAVLTPGMQIRLHGDMRELPDGRKFPRVLGYFPAK